MGANRSSCLLNLPVRELPDVRSTTAAMVVADVVVDRCAVGGVVRTRGR